MKTCIYKQHSTKCSYCTNCDTYIRHDTSRFYDAKQELETKMKFNYCPNCGAKIIERVKLDQQIKSLKGEK